MKNRHLMHVDFTTHIFGLGVVVSSKLGLSIMLGPILVQFLVPREPSTPT